ncbi:hypothetical protein [Yinghuangia sp. YIM S09857]|uniref:hypothetical protein n=1 Tax=Yinghuangia sp. YIM S09857 TaxID=3436929 RepID=UPI003F53912C
MARPDPHVELKIGGVWTDITSDFYTRAPLTITRGRSDEGARVDPGRCSFVLNNRHGTYSPRNPMSPLYGLIGRNTPVRVTAAGTTPHLRVDGGSAQVPSSPAIDITGDLDVSIDLSLDNWVAPPGLVYVLMGRWDSTPGAVQFGWRLYLDNAGFLGLQWSADGTTLETANPAGPMHFPASGRMAFRVTLDVDNGAGGRTTTFYTAETMSGPWTMLGPPVVEAGTTAIFDPPVPLAVGRTFVNSVSVTSSEGRIYAAEVRDGIDGTVVANPDFTAQSVGATGFVDGAGRTWTMTGQAKITKHQIRFVGEVPSWPARWDVSGADVYVPIQAAGVLRRYGQGARALSSALRRQLPPAGPQAYWPMEDGTETTRAYSPIPGVDAMTATGFQWGAVSSLPSSGPLPAVASADGALCEFWAPVPGAPTPVPTAWSVQCVYRAEEIKPSLATLLRVRVGSGTFREWLLQQSGTAFNIVALDADGSILFSGGVGTGSDLYKQWIRLELFVSQVGGNIDWLVVLTDVGGNAGTASGTLAGTNGYPVGVGSPAGGYAADLDGLALGHLSVWNFGFLVADPYAGAIDSWTGERAGRRAQRLTHEEAVPLTIYGDLGTSEPMGMQGQSTLLDLLGECADTDVGILHELRNTTGLALRLRETLYNQPPRLTLSYAEGGEVAPPLEPEDDDQGTRNDSTVTRAGGSSGRVVREDGPLSVLPPPHGVGVYPESVTRSLAEDAQAEPHAAWRVHLGTVDEPRYPVVHVALHAAPHLVEDACEVESGDRLVITDLPPWLPPGDADLMAQGYSETLTATEWHLYFNCTPASPWLPAVADAAVYGHADTDGCVLAAAVTDTATTLLAATTAGRPWVTGTASGTVIEDFEDAVLDITITDGGDLPWVRTTSAAHSGSWSLRAGAITDDLTSDAIIDVPAEAYSLQFWYRVDSERDFDHFRVLVDAVEILTLSGDIGWTQSPLIDVSDASTVTFRYTKDGSEAVGADTAWVDDIAFVGDLPFDIHVGGERMTVTAISGAASPQTMTVVRSVNGIVKAHAADSDLRLADAPFAGL